MHRAWLFLRVARWKNLCAGLIGWDFFSILIPRKVFTAPSALRQHSTHHTAHNSNLTHSQRRKRASVKHLKFSAQRQALDQKHLYVWTVITDEDALNIKARVHVHVFYWWLHLFFLSTWEFVRFFCAFF